MRYRGSLQHVEFMIACILSLCFYQCLLTNHVLSNMCHGVELLLTDLTGELFLCVAVHDFDVLM